MVGMGTQMMGGTEKRGDLSMKDGGCGGDAKDVESQKMRCDRWRM